MAKGKKSKGRCKEDMWITIGAVVAVAFSTWLSYNGYIPWWLTWGV